MAVEQYNLINGDWLGLGYIINDLATRVVGQLVSPGSSPTFAGATLSGLTASRLVQTDADIALVSVTDLTNWIVGTANQISVAGADGAVTLSTPQDIHTGASPTFVRVTANGMSSPAGTQLSFVSVTQSIIFTSGMGYGIGLNGNVVICPGHTLSHYLTEIIGVDGEVNAAVIEDKFLRNDGDDETSGIITSVGYITTGKLTAGSFSSPLDVTATREYGFEIHYSGNNYNVTGFRSRASLITTDTTASAQGGLFQAANTDGINAGVLNGLLAEAIGKSTTTAATISMMRAGIFNAEWGAFDTVTQLNTLHVRVHSLNVSGAGSFGDGYGIYIENEAVGGNGQALDAGIYFKGTNLSAGNKAFDYGIDFSGGTFTTAEIKFSNGETISNLVDGQLNLGSANTLTTGTLGAGATTLTSASQQLLLKYDDNNTVGFECLSTGRLNITPTGNEVHIYGTAPAMEWRKLPNIQLARMGHNNTNCTFYNYKGDFQIRNVGSISTGNIYFYTDNVKRMAVWRVGLGGHVSVYNYLKIGSSDRPENPLDITLATEDFDVVDAGSVDATEQNWLEVLVGGNTGYVRVFATK